MDFTSLIVQLLGGVAGGNAAGKGLPSLDLGAVGNTIAGALGGVGGGQLLQALIPARAAAGSISAPSSDSWSAAARAARS
jgi:hypothetical protein